MIVQTSTWYPELNNRIRVDAAGSSEPGTNKPYFHVTIAAKDESTNRNSFLIYGTADHIREAIAEIGTALAAEELHVAQEHGHLTPQEAAS